MDRRATVGLTNEAKRYVVGDHLSVVIPTALAFGAAQTLGWWNAWLYGGVALAVKLVSAVVLAGVNPAVLHARGTRHPMSKREKAFFAVFVPAGFAVPIVAGLHVGAAGWTHRSTVELAGGLAVMVLGMATVICALAVNDFFEPTVRIQTDRAQQVCRAGPYRFVRHPGYVGAILAGAGVPFIFGSMWCFVPIAVWSIALVIRTRYEDRMLHAELAGYEAYAKETRFRLLPGVW